MGGQTSSKSRASKAELPQVAVHIHLTQGQGLHLLCREGQTLENMGPESQELLDPSKLLTSSWDLG